MNILSLYLIKFINKFINRNSIIYVSPFLEEIKISCNDKIPVSNNPSLSEINANNSSSSLSEINKDNSSSTLNSYFSEINTENLIKQDKLDEFENYKMNVKTRIHDIKTPLNNIVLTVDSDDNISPENKLNVIENSYLIKDLLNDLLKNENNLEDFKFNPKKIILSKLTKKIKYLTNSEFKIQNKNMNIIILGYDCDYFYGDEKLIIRMLVNLIKNSLKYQTELFTEIKLVIENKVKNQILITKFIIIDENDELTIEIQNNIFKPFNTTNNSGLGLYICKRIVELHNGSIEYKRIENTNNFIMTLQFHMLSLPFEKKNQDNDSSSSEDSSKVFKKIKKLVNQTQFDLNDKKKILLIDDCFVTLKMMKFIIQKIDKNKIYNINTLTQIEKDFYSENNRKKILDYDIIITDYQIGNNTCLEFLKFLNLNNEYNGKIYCITGNEDNNIIKELKLYVNSIYFKPIKYDDLKKIIDYDT